MWFFIIYSYVTYLYSTPIDQTKKLIKMNEFYKKHFIIFVIFVKKKQNRFNLDKEWNLNLFLFIFKKRKPEYGGNDEGFPIKMPNINFWSVTIRCCQKLCKVISSLGYEMNNFEAKRLFCNLKTVAVMPLWHVRLRIILFIWILRYKKLHEQFLI